MSGYVGNKKSVSFVSAELPIRKGIESIVEEDGSYRLLDGASLKKSDGSPVIHSDGTIDGVDLSPIQNQIDSIEADITSLNSSIDMVEASLDTVEASLDTVEASIPSHSMNFRNKIINGDMRIDQRNGGSAVTASAAFPVDRFPTTHNTAGAFSAQQVTDAPAGFTNSVKYTVTTADASIGATQMLLLRQFIEGNNIADLSWGTANAKTVTLSFWVRSSVTGTFGGSIGNSANDRYYSYSYNISSADTWEYKTVTIAGDTSGTWLTDTDIGVRVYFTLAAGADRVQPSGSWQTTGGFIAGVTGQVQLIETLNATWYITGVQLEEGAVATPFEHRPYGLELSLCQRYCQVLGNGMRMYGMYDSVSGNAVRYFQFLLPQRMRTSPTVSNLSITNTIGFGASANPTNVDFVIYKSGVGYNESISFDSDFILSAEL